MKVPKIILIIAIIVVAIILLLALLVATFRLRHRNQQLSYGVSFSKPYAQELGLDWEAAYRAVLSELGIKKLRLMSYWEQHEPAAAKYDFADLDKQFELAQQHGVKVSLAVGLRQPRWPECHQPEWAKELGKNARRVALNTYLQKVVERYRNHPALESWQLENEYYNRDFGSNCPDFSRLRLRDEYARVKQLDPSHPIIMNQSNQFGIPLSRPHPDVYGFSIYKRVYEANLLKRYITHPMPAWFHSLRAQIVEMLWRKPVVIHELQAEPWTTKPVTQVSAQEQAATMSSLQLRRNLSFANKTGIKEQYLWGAEYWYWRKTHGDPSYWQIVQSAVKNIRH